ncbi:hypothetical protein ACHHYP_08158 [Achlya hypogyna]|uniref:WW domain-containing protein n=1 Tax=Achlya hypogyna TaxID=1202772 RepID=A0A1V9ZL69_ACHHY|nr:hypothetical protein ACHHYP_08158 [Achlya hypogyna]
MDIYRISKLKLFKKKKGHDLRAQSVFDLQRFRALYLGASQSRGLAPPSVFDKMVYRAISSQTNLTHLDFRGQELTDNQLLALVETLLEIPILSSLDLRDNHITEEGGLSLLELLRHQLITAKASPQAPASDYTRLLTKVELKGNNISDATLHTIRQYTAMLAREDKRLEIKTILGQLDYNASGSLDEAEIRVALKLCGGSEPTKKEVATIVEELGLLSWQLSTSPSQKQTAETNLRACLENILLARYARTPTKKDMDGALPLESLAQIRHAELVRPSMYNVEPDDAPAPRSSVRLGSSLESDFTIGEAETPPVELESPPPSPRVSPFKTGRPPPIIIPEPTNATPLSSPVVSPIGSSVASPMAVWATESPVSLSAATSPLASGGIADICTPAALTSVAVSSLATVQPVVSVDATSPTLRPIAETFVDAQPPAPASPVGIVVPAVSTSPSAAPSSPVAPTLTSLSPLVSPDLAQVAPLPPTVVSRTPSLVMAPALEAPLDMPMLEIDYMEPTTPCPPTLENIAGGRFEPIVDVGDNGTLEHTRCGHLDSPHSSFPEAFRSDNPEQFRSETVSDDCQTGAMAVTEVDSRDEDTTVPYTCEQQQALYQGCERLVVKLQHPEFASQPAWPSLFPDMTFTNVMALILCDNQLETISFQEMSLRHLRVLDLSSNRLSKLTATDMQPLRQLEILDLSFNAFRSIHGVEHLINLKALNFAGNHIKSVKNLEFLGKLEILNLAQNDILTPQALRLLSLNKHLTHLNVDDNPVVSQGNHRHHSAHILNIIPTLRSLGCIHLAALILREKKKSRSPKDDAPPIVEAVTATESPYWIAQACQNVGLVCDETPAVPSPKKLSRHEQRSRDELRAKSFAHHVKKEPLPPPPAPEKPKSKSSFTAQQKRAIMLSTPKPSAIKPPPAPKPEPPLPAKSIPVVSTLKGFLQPTQASIHSTLAAEREKAIKPKKPKSALHKRLLRREEKLRQYLVATSPAKPPTVATAPVVASSPPPRVVVELSPAKQQGEAATTDAFLQGIRFREFELHVKEDHATAVSALDILVAMVERRVVDVAKYAEFKANVDSMQILGHIEMEGATKGMLSGQANMARMYKELGELKVAVQMLLGKIDLRAQTGMLAAPVFAALCDACREVRAQSIGSLLSEPAATSLDLLSPTTTSADPFGFDDTVFARETSTNIVVADRDVRPINVSVPTTVAEPEPNADDDLIFGTDTDCVLALRCDEADDFGLPAVESEEEEAEVTGDGNSGEGDDEGACNETLAAVKTSATEVSDGIELDANQAGMDDEDLEEPTTGESEVAVGDGEEDDAASDDDEDVGAADGEKPEQAAAGEDDDEVAAGEDDDEEAAAGEDDDEVGAVDEEAEEVAASEDDDALTFGDWEQGFDDASQHHYWFNTETEESSWTAPPGWPYDLEGNLLTTGDDDEDNEEDADEDQNDAEEEQTLEERIARALQGDSSLAPTNSGDDEVDFSDNDSLPDL